MHAAAIGEPASRERIGRALDAFRPWLESWVRQALADRPGARLPAAPDVQALLRAILDHWEAVFAARLPGTARSWVHELRDVRNRWAHQVPFTEREMRRALDTVAILAEAIELPARVVDALVAASTAPSAASSAPPVGAAPPPPVAAPPRVIPSRRTAPSAAVERDAAGVIVNAEALTADDVAMQRVRCPGCGRHDFVEWSAGWDAHAAHRCHGMTAATPEARKAEFRARFGHLFRRATGGASQRDVMRRIWRDAAGDDARAIAAWAEAERTGQVVRRSNAHGITAEQYALALLRDGLAKGWLRAPG